MISVDRLGTVGAAAAIAATALLAREVLARARELELTGRTVLIVGGSRGLGPLLARRFAAEGADVAICARDQEQLERAMHWLADAGHDVLAITCDAADRDQVADLVRRVEERLGSVDLLVNNAAVMQVGRLDQMTVEDFEDAHASAF